MDKTMFNLLFLASQNTDINIFLLLAVVAIVILAIVLLPKTGKPDNATENKWATPTFENEKSQIPAQRINACVSEIKETSCVGKLRKNSKDGIETKKITWFLSDGRMFIVEVVNGISIHEGVASPPWTRVTVKYRHQDERYIVSNATVESLRFRYRKSNLADMYSQLLKQCEDLVVQQH